MQQKVINISVRDPRHPSGLMAVVAYKTKAAGLVVHRSLDAACKPTGSWIITHENSGLRLGNRTYRYRAQAVRVANRLRSFDWSFTAEDNPNLKSHYQAFCASLRMEERCHR